MGTLPKITLLNLRGTPCEAYSHLEEDVEYDPIQTIIDVRGRLDIYDLIWVIRKCWSFDKEEAIKFLCSLNPTPSQILDLLHKRIDFDIPEVMKILKETFLAGKPTSEEMLCALLGYSDFFRSDDDAELFLDNSPTVDQICQIAGYIGYLPLQPKIMKAFIATKPAKKDVLKLIDLCGYAYHNMEVVELFFSLKPGKKITKTFLSMLCSNFVATPEFKNFLNSL